jgi:hypothetical protein
VAQSTVAKYMAKPGDIASTVAATGITYFVSDMAFGTIPLEAASRSVELFARKVLPQFQ